MTSSSVGAGLLWKSFAGAAELALMIFDAVGFISHDARDCSIQLDSTHCGGRGVKMSGKLFEF